MNDKVWTAGLVVIGDEILSGRTQDLNVQYLATWLNERGVRLTEVRVVSDVTEHIVHAVNKLRTHYDYCFTTGGIGPTHDDITADAIAEAFGVPIWEDPEAIRRLSERYEITEKRRRMARIPKGGILIDNPVSQAPGFQMENVFTMAGIPKVMQAMLSTFGDRVKGGFPLLSRDVVFKSFESKLAGPLEDLQHEFPDVSMGSYPFLLDGEAAVQIVARCTDEARLEAALESIKALGTPVEKKTND